MVDWTVENCPPSAENSPFILDIGSGNGFLLFSLAEAGYKPSALCGIDYSPDATRLATLISESRSAREISFKACEFLSEDVPSLPGMSGEHPRVWDLLLDKGTYDAIALGVKDEDEAPANMTFGAQTDAIDANAAQEVIVPVVVEVCPHSRPSAAGLP